MKSDLLQLSRRVDLLLLRIVATELCLWLLQTDWRKLHRLRIATNCVQALLLQVRGQIETKQIRPFSFSIFNIPKVRIIGRKGVCISLCKFFIHRKECVYFDLREDK